jgi:hypothetical protein
MADQQMDVQIQSSCVKLEVIHVRVIIFFFLKRSFIIVFTVIWSMSLWKGVNKGIFYHVLWAFCTYNPEFKKQCCYRQVIAHLMVDLLFLYLFRALNDLSVGWQGLVEILTWHHCDLTQVFAVREREETPLHVSAVWSRTQNVPGLSYWIVPTQNSSGQNSPQIQHRELFSNCGTWLLLYVSVPKQSVESTV